MIHSKRLIKLMAFFSWAIVAGIAGYGKAQSWASRCFMASLLAVSSLAWVGIAAAGPLYFSGTNSTWDNATTRDWATSSAGPFTSLWSGGSDAYFLSPAGTVTVSQTITSVNSLNFEVTGYTLIGGSIDLTGSGGSISVAAGNATINSVLAGSVGLTMIGNGLLTLGGANTYSNATTISGGTLQIGNGGTGASISDTTRVLDNACLVFNHANSASFSPVISGSGSLTQMGTGVLTLTASDTYSGSTTIGGGTLQIGNGGSGASIGNTSSVLDNGSLVFNHVDSVSFSPVISGSGSLTQMGTGRLTLTSSNSYSGGTTLSGGSLSVGNAGCFGTGPITLAGGTLVNNTTVTNNLIASVSTTSTITPTSSSATAFAGSLTGSGVVNFSGGAGFQTFMNGDLSAFSGTLAFGTSGSGVWFNGATGTATTFNAGAGDFFAFASTAVGTQTYNLGALSGVAGSRIFSSPGTGNAITLSIGALNTSSSFAGVIQNDQQSATDTTSTIGLTKVGSGALTLLGSNTYTGLTSIDGGTLCVGNSGALAGNGNITFGGGTLRFSVSNAQGYANSIVNSTGPIQIDTDGQSVTFAGSLASSNTDGLTKLNTGTLTLTAGNTYSGSTTISGGTLQIGNGGSGASIGSTSSVLDNASLVFNHADSVSFSPVISGSGSLTQTGTGELTLTASNTYSGTTTINGGTLQIGNGGTGASIGSTSSVLDNANASLVFNNADNVTFSKVISGSGSLTQLGTGVLTLTASDTYRGSTTISGGTLQIGSGGSGASIGSTSRVLDNASLVFNHADSVSFAPVISGSGSLTQMGTGQLTLTASNSYSGGTTLSGGSLSVGNAACFGSGPITLVGGTLVNGTTIANNLIASVSTTSTITPASSSATIFSGALTGSGVVNFSGGAGFQTFMNGNLSAFTGTLSFGTSGSEVWFNGATGTAATFNAGAGDVLAFASTAVGTRTYNLGALSGAAGSHIFSSPRTANAITLSIGALNTSSTFAGVIQNDDLSATDTTSTIGLTKVGSGALTLLGSNTYTGLTSIDGGTLCVGNSGALAGNGNITFGGGTLRFSASNTQDYGSRIINSTGPIQIDTNGQSVTFAGSLASSNTGGLTKLNTGTLTLTAGNTYSGSTTISGGTLQIGNGGSGASIGSTSSVLDNGSLVFDHADSVSFSPVISGSGSLTQMGTGRLTLTSSNSYSGGTTLSGGSLIVGNAACIGTGPITLAGGTLVSGTTIANNLIASVSTTSTITPTSSSATAFSGSLTGSGVVNFSGGTGLQTFMNGNLSAFSGTLAFGTSGSGVWFNGATGTATTFNAGAGDFFAFASTAVGTQTYNLGALSGAAGSRIFSSPGTGNTITLSIGALNTSSSFSGIIQNDEQSPTDTTSTIGLTKVGSGVLTLLGSNTYTGLTSINGGTLSLGSSGALAGNGNITFGGGTLRLSTLNTQDYSNRIVNSTGPIQIDTNGQNVTFAGSLASSNTGGLTKLNTGTLTLTAGNTYSGSTTIAGGTLQIGNGGSGASIGGTSSVLDNGSLVFNHADSVSFSQVISGSGSLTQAGTGVLILTASNTYSGTTTVRAGTLQVGDGGTGASIGSTANVVDDGSLVFNNADNVTFSKVISGNGSLTQMGAGVLTLTGTNTFTGTVTVSAGTLQITSGQLPAANETVAPGVTASVVQTGGTHSPANLVIGTVDENEDGGNGFYTLSGGQLTVRGTESIGQGLATVGSFTQTGGTHSVANLIIADIDVEGNGGNGSYTLGGGLLTVTGTESIGQGLAAVGNFTQTGGTHNAASLVIGDADQNENGGNGFYTLSGGQLSVRGTESIGLGGNPGDSAAGNFTQTGGTHSVASLVIGAVDQNEDGGNGSYTLNGGQLTVTVTESIGQGLATVGSFTQTGGTHNAANLVIGDIDGDGNGGSGSYTLSDGQLSVTGNESIGQGQATVGSFTQTGGTHNAANLVIGDVDVNGNGGNGSYTLSGGQLTVTETESIGQGGNLGASSAGSFTQTGGTHNVATLLIGDIDVYGNGGTGSYTLSGGQLTVTGYESIGQGGNFGASAVGSFTQTGGTHNAADLVIGDIDGNGNGGNGSYTLGGSGLLTVTGYELIGQGGNAGASTDGSFTQTGGTHNVTSLVIGAVDGNENGGNGFYTLNGNGLLTVTGNESIGQGLAAVGTFTQTGGTHNAADLVIGDIDVYGNGGSGSYTLSGGQLSVPGTESIGGGGNPGASAVGSFTQTGGSHSVTSLLIGTVDVYGNGGDGSYVLSGGQLTVTGNESIGQGGYPGATAVGSFTQTGGTHSVASLVIGDIDGNGNGGNGSYILSGGQLSVTGTESIGGGGFSGASAVGSFTQTGGTHGVASLIIGATDGYGNGGNGSYTLGGGQLTVSGNESIGQGGFPALSALGSFTQTGGTHSVASLVIGDIDVNGNGGNGSYALSGGQLSVTGAELIGGGGNPGVAAVGSFTQTGGSHSVASLVIGAADEYGNGGNGSYTLGGGQLAVSGNESIGQGGFPSVSTGSFIQTGGTHSVASLVIGDIDQYGNGGNGSYTLGGGQLTVSGNESIGHGGNLGATAVGSFTQTGGTHSVANLVVGDIDQYGNGGNGSYTLSGGQLSVTGTESIGQGLGAVGSFTQTGGTHSISVAMAIGWLAGGSGTYAFSGGSLSAPAAYIGYAGSGTFTQTGGTVALGSLVLAESAASAGTYNLNGGVLALPPGGLSRGSGTATFNFGGGTLAASSVSPARPDANVSGTPGAGDLSSTSLNMIMSGIGGDGTIDTSGGNMGLTGILSGSGGLIKIGDGALILSGSNTYTGDTTVDDGALYITNSDALPAGSSLVVGADATLIFDPSGGGAPDYLSHGSAVAVAAVPEPGTLALLIAGLVMGFAAWPRKRWILQHIETGRSYRNNMLDGNHS